MENYNSIFYNQFRSKELYDVNLIKSNRLHLANPLIYEFYDPAPAMIYLFNNIMKDIIQPLLEIICATLFDSADGTG